MTPMSEDRDAILAAVSSITTCTSVTVVSLKKLLECDNSDASHISKPLSIRTKKDSATCSKTKPGAATRVATGKASRSDKDGLSVRDQSALATNVINATLKCLNEKAKVQVLGRKAPSVQSPIKPSNGKTPLRTSLSAPTSPLQPRTLNRVDTSTSITSSNKTSPSMQSTGCLAVVECASLALACLRSIKGPVQADQTDFQLEHGTLSLVGKLLTLGMHDQTLKQLRIIKSRIDKEPAKDSHKPSARISDLLDFHQSSKTLLHRLDIVTSYQIQVLKLLAATRKAADIEAAAPLLDETRPNSPTVLLEKLSNGATGKEAERISRLMATSSQLVLSLAPSIASKEDAIATEASLHPTPLVALDLQCLAFRTQLRWWKLAGYQGKADEEVIAPLGRCLRAFFRRHTSLNRETFIQVTRKANEIIASTQERHQVLVQGLTSPLASIRHTMGKAAQTCKAYDSAKECFHWLYSHVDRKTDSAVQVCTVTARLLAVSLKNDQVNPEIERLLEEVIEGLEENLSGTSIDLNELFDALLATRRSVVGVLMKEKQGVASSLEQVSAPQKQRLRQFLLNFPRFLRRWLGSSPSQGASAKIAIQYEQRRQLLLPPVGQIMDATFMIVKGGFDCKNLDLQQIDGILQDCATLLSSVTDCSLAPSRLEQLEAHSMKLSGLYFSMFTALRQTPTDKGEDKRQIILTAERSVDALRGCNSKNKQKAQFVTKLELLGDLYKSYGKNEDALRVVRSACRHLVDEGVLSSITSDLACRPPVEAWNADVRTSSLSRALRSMTRLDTSWNEWTFFMAEHERAAVLEHLILSGSSLQHKPKELLQFCDPTVTTLLRLYTLKKYPIRRLRVLLYIQYQNVGNVEQLDDISASIDETESHLDAVKQSEDRNLTQFIPHWRTYRKFVLLLARGAAELGAGSLEAAVTEWTDMLRDCQTKEDLMNIVDDPLTLLDQLNVMEQYAGLKGQSRLQLSILYLLKRISSLLENSSQVNCAISNSLIISRLVRYGRLEEAGTIMDEARKVLDQTPNPPKNDVLWFHLSEVEYWSALGDTEQATIVLSTISERVLTLSQPKAESKSRTAISQTTLNLLKSIVALQTGDIQEALSSVKSGLRLISYEWSRLEAAALVTIGSETDRSEATASLSEPSQAASTNHTVGPSFWALAYPFLRSLLQMSMVQAHIGMLQETLYYAQTAWKIAGSCQSSLFKAEVGAWLGSIYTRAARPQDALPYIVEAENSFPQEPSPIRVQLARQLANFYLQLENTEQTQRYLAIAEETVQHLGKDKSPPVVSQHASVAASTTKAKVARAPRTTRATGSAKAPAPLKGARQPARKEIAKSPRNVDKPASKLPQDVVQTSLLAGTILVRTTVAMREKDWSSALSSLEQLQDVPKLVSLVTEERLARAEYLIGHGAEQMIGDPVFSVIQDSTISFPAVNGSLEISMHDQPSSTASTQRKGRSVTSTKTKHNPVPAFVEAFRQAQELLLDVYMSSFAKSESSIVHRVGALLQQTVMLLSVASPSKSTVSKDCTFAVVASDLARNTVWKREQRSLQVSPDAAKEQPQPPALHSDSIVVNRRTSLFPVCDAGQFQRQYIDVIPKNWTVISLSLSDDRSDLCVTKLEAGHSPFVLRLPLERANCRDADSAPLDFAQGREEMLEIIRLANETSHSGKEMTVKDEWQKWWEEREILDKRLQELLGSIENTWLGGFKGIFSQHQRQPELLARFQQNFQRILDGCLPSRKQTRGKKSPVIPRLNLDPRILALFIGLGDPTDPDLDFDEALNDLLYFVVDILQFQGERNAYDEIDFDAMVVETYDALRGYYNSSHISASTAQDAHTVLVLDKALRTFPWESMPCMEGLAVSRVPSLAYLERLIKDTGLTENASLTETVDEDEDGADADNTKVAGHHVSADSGTYILNPSADLKNTQTYFQSGLLSLTSWTKIVKKAPEEPEFVEALSQSDILLYFGHGSGAQYIKGKSVRKLAKCKPATFLMGCSSAALTEAGEFESYGTVWNYMMAGCPAVVGTLWDVTDRDIDRFAGRAFEEWGLFPASTFKEETQKGKTKAKGRRLVEDEVDKVGVGQRQGDGVKISLVQAVAKARAACRLRYLNAAAVIVYGIPVYLKK